MTYQSNDPDLILSTEYQSESEESYPKYSPMELVLLQVESERLRQDRKWGRQDHEQLYWLAILGEEFGEVSKEVCELRVDENHLANAVASNLAPEEIEARAAALLTRLRNLRTELIQTAAVACAAIESLDRNELAGAR